MIALFTQLAAGLILLSVLAVALAAPIAWLLMLFLGNVGLNVSFWGALPGALVVAVVGSSKTEKK